MDNRIKAAGPIATKFGPKCDTVDKVRPKLTKISSLLSFANWLQY